MICMKYWKWKCLCGLWKCLSCSICLVTYLNNSVIWKPAAPFPIFGIWERERERTGFMLETIVWNSWQLCQLLSSIKKLLKKFSSGGYENYKLVAGVCFWWSTRWCSAAWMRVFHRHVWQVPVIAVISSFYMAFFISSIHSSRNSVQEFSQALLSAHFSPLSEMYKSGAWSLQKICQGMMAEKTVCADSIIPVKTACSVVSQIILQYVRHQKALPFTDSSRICSRSYTHYIPSGEWGANSWKVYTFSTQWMTPCWPPLSLTHTPILLQFYFTLLVERTTAIKSGKWTACLPGSPSTSWQKQFTYKLPHIQNPCNLCHN